MCSAPVLQEVCFWAVTCMTFTDQINTQLMCGAFSFMPSSEFSLSYGDSQERFLCKGKMQISEYITWKVEWEDTALHKSMFLSYFCSSELCCRIPALWTPFRSGFHKTWQPKLLRTHLPWCTGTNYWTSLWKTERQICHEGVFTLKNTLLPWSYLLLFLLITSC